MDKKTKIILGISGVILFMILFITGITYAWFSANVTGNETAKGTIVQTGTLSINYTNGYNIGGDNIVPGWSETKTFTVENTGTREAFYELDWANITNEFINKGDLVYTITGITNGTKEPGSISEKSLPLTGTNIKMFSNIEIESGKTHTYTVRVLYMDNGNQSSDMGKSLTGKIEVKSSEKYKNCVEANNCLVDNVNVGQFVGYTSPAGKSGDSKTCVEGNNSQYSGWRVLSKSGTGLSGIVTLVHAGTPECYNAPFSRDELYKGVAVLNNIGNLYVNNELATLGRNMNCNDVKVYDSNACTISYGQTIENDLINIGAPYWLASTQDVQVKKRDSDGIFYYEDESRLENVSSSGAVNISFGNILSGVRPVIVLKSGIKNTGGQGTNESPFTISN